MDRKLSNSGLFNVALLSAGHFFSDFYANFLPALLPVIVVKLGLSLTLSGMLVMAYSVIASVLQPISGYIIDKRGYAWLILITTPVSAVFICLAGLADSKIALFLCVGLAGLGSSVFHPLAASLMARVVTDKTRGTAMSVFVFGGSAGFAAAPAVIMYMLSTGGTASLLWLIIPGLIVTGACYRCGLHKIKLSRAVTGDHDQASTQMTAWYKSRGLILLNVVTALRSWMLVALPTFLPLVLIRAGQPPVVAASMLTVLLLSGAVGSLAGGWLGDRVGRKACMIGSLTLCLPVTYLFLTDLSPSLVSYSLLILSGALLQGATPTAVVWAQELIPGNAALASGMMLGMAYGLGGVGAAITGALGDRIGLESALMWSLLSLVFAVILTFAIPQPNSETYRKMNI